MHWFQYMTFLFGLAADQRELVKILVVISPLFHQKRVEVDFFFFLACFDEQNIFLEKASEANFSKALNWDIMDYP